MSSRQAWSTEQVLGHPDLHSETLPQKQRKSQNKKELKRLIVQMSIKKLFIKEMAKEKPYQRKQKSSCGSRDYESK